MRQIILRYVVTVVDCSRSFLMGIVVICLRFFVWNLEFEMCFGAGGFNGYQSFKGEEES